MTKCVFFVRHCERVRRAWQSTNLNANFYLWIATNLHAHALQILAMTKNSCHTEALAEVSTNLKCEFALLRRLKFFGFFCCGLRLATRWVATLKMTMEIFCFLVQAQNVSFDDDKNLNA